MTLRLTAIPPAEYASLADLLEENRLLASDLSGGDKRFFAFEDAQGWRIGVGGLELAGSDALLRSLLTLNAHRGQGLGGQMLEEIAGHAASLGVTDLYLFTEDAEGFFDRHGFARADRAAAPAGIRATRQFQIHCTDGVFMHRRLP